MTDDDTRRTIARGRFLELLNDDGWEFVERCGASGVVAVLAITAADEIVLTQQYRPPVNSEVIDLPAGLSGDIDGAQEESLETAARRELEEETGFRAQSLRHVARLPTSPGLTSEVIDLFVAEGITLVSQGGGDEGESITVHLIPLNNVATWLDERASDQCLIDPKVYTALWWTDRLR